MPMLKKILSIIAKIITGIFVFYLFASLVIIPVVAPWVIRSQGAKLLKTTVKMRQVLFNPFLLRVTLKGLEILDAGKQVMVGFDRAWGDISFISLLKKQYRVEALAVEGLKVNITLMPGNKINLLALVPEMPATTNNATTVSEKTQVQTNTPAQQVNTAKSQAVLPQNLPLVFIDTISLKQGNICFTDKTVTPNFVTTLSNMNISITGLSTKPDCLAKMVFKANFDDKGVMESEAQICPFINPPQLEAHFSLNDYALGILTPYTGKYTGREVGSGKLNFNMDYRIGDNKITAGHKVLVQSFDFGKKVESKDALNLPYGLAIALLEDPQGRIKISLPVTGDMSKPDFHYLQVLGQVARNFFVKLVTKPFMFLATIAGAETGTEETGFARFLPGKADLSPEEREKLNTLVKGLNERPKLLLEINGSYDTDIDWKAIKTDTFNTDFAVLKKESTHNEGWICQELYQRSFGIRALWELTKAYKSKMGVYDEAKINAEIKKRLIDDAPPDKVALEALALARAKVVYDFILAAGFDAKRLSIGQSRSTTSSMGYVPLEFTLTVFEDKPDIKQ